MSRRQLTGQVVIEGLLLGVLVLCSVLVRVFSCLRD